MAWYHGISIVMREYRNMKKVFKPAALLLILALCLCLLCGCTDREVAGALDAASELAGLLADSVAGADAGAGNAEADVTEDAQDPEGALDVEGSYSSAEDVALYIHTYGCLPDNFVTKDEARDAGWNGGGLERYLPGKCIGGDRFGNREGLLPDAKGRVWTECDIDTLGASSRGAKRIVFSNDGLIYYSDDHYDSFQLLYGETP